MEHWTDAQLQECVNTGTIEELRSALRETQRRWEAQRQRADEETARADDNERVIRHIRYVLSLTRRCGMDYLRLESSPWIVHL